MNTNIDHIVIGATTLEQGMDYIKRTLGVDIPFGGVHPKMGTHNLLMQLSDSLFLEVIAINAEIPAPTYPRWFGLDDPYVRQNLKAGPALLTWVVNTENIRLLMLGSSFSFGTPKHISRGNLSWYFGLPDDGRLLASGLLPYIIEWQTDRHPAVAMANVSCQLQGITLYHPRANWLKSILESINIKHQVEIEALAENATPYLVAAIKTPDAVVELRSIL